MNTTHSFPNVRRTRFIPVLFAFVVFLFCSKAEAQKIRPDCNGTAITGTPSNAGTNFLLCFEQNNYRDSEPNDDEFLEIYVASLGDTATVTITTNSHPTVSKVLFLQADSSKTYRISDEMSNLWLTSDEVPDDRVVKVQSTSPIVCYGLNNKDATADAFLALPFESAAAEYRILSYPNSNNPQAYTSGDWMPSQFAVAAFQDNTTVTITPSAATAGGRAAGVPFQVTLQSGQGYQVQTDPSVDALDLTGSTVASDKPVAVYSGHARTEIPYQFLRTDVSTSRDMLLEAMPPTSAWGTAFVLNAIDIDAQGTKNPGGDLMRVVALNDNTTVTVNGNPWVTLNHNQFADSMISSPVLVKGSGALLVGEYAHTDINNNSNGDPFLAVVPAVDQSFNNYTFFAPDKLDYPLQKVIIVTDTLAQNSILFDGQALPGRIFQKVPGSIGGHAYALTEYTGFNQGAHTITSMMPPEDGFTILSYGLGKVISYGYTAGILLVPKRAIGIQYPPQAMGGHHTNTIDFRNTAYQDAYLDSAVFIADNPKMRNLGIHVKERIAYDIGVLPVGQSAEIHLVSDDQLPAPVEGTLRIYSHLPSYMNLEPAEMPFTLYPDAEAGVAENNSPALSAFASPNPFSSYTTVNFSVPETGDITMVLYDELGRVVQQVASSEFPAGPYSVRIERRGLPDGVYTCVITSQKLHINERVPIVAGE